MYERFEQLLKEHGVSAYKVSKETGIPQPTLSGWKRTNRTPQIRTLKAIADYFGVSVEYLKGETDDRGQKEKPAPVSGSGLSEDAIKIGKAFDAAAPELKNLVEAALSGPQTIQADTVAIRITCPIDHTEQVIHQPVYRIDGKTIPERNNNGCEMCRPCEECTLCRLRAAASLL